MRTVAILPIKSFGEAKQRLSHEFDAPTRRALAQSCFFQIGVCAVYFQTDAAADHDSDNGIRNLLLESHRNPHVHRFAASPYRGRLPVRAQSFDLQDFGAADLRSALKLVQRGMRPGGKAGISPPATKSNCGSAAPPTFFLNASNTEGQ